MKFEQSAPKAALKNKLYTRLKQISGLVFGMVLAFDFAGQAVFAQDSKKAEESAFSFDSVLTTDILSNQKGGLKKGTRAMTNLDLSVSWAGPKGWEAFGYALADADGGFSERLSGDAQVVSNIDAPAGVRLFEAWIRKTSQDEKWMTSFGLMNVNSQFDVQEVAGTFMNASHGLGADFAQSGPAAFPFSALGLSVEWRAKETMSLRLGVYDGVAGDPDHMSAFVGQKLGRKDGSLIIGEVEKRFEGGYVKLGHWAYSRPFERIDGSGQKRGTSGTYGQIAATLYREKSTEDQGLKAWVRHGAANPSVMDIATYTGAGLVYTGPIKGRDHDAVGIALAKARYGKPYRAAQMGPVSEETSYELTYQYEVRPGFVVQPDLQYIRRPAGSHDQKDAVVIGLRVRIGLEAFKP